MKYVRMLTLAAVAASALMAFIGAGTASANKICSTATNPCTSPWPNDIAKVDFSSEGSTRLIDVSTGETTDTCKESTLTGTFTQGTTASNPGKPILHATELKWSNCTFPTTTTELGTLEIDATSGGNGTVTGKNFKVTINTVFFGSCVYGTGESISLGEITEGNPAIFHAAVHVPFISGGFACPRTSEWNATYKITSPSNTTGYVSSS